jgi:oligosaccharide repeat unit polymerase
MTWLTILVWSLLGIAALLIRRREGSWFSPASFFVGIWTIFAGVPIIAGPIPVEPAGLFVVLAATLALFAGAEAARRVRPWPIQVAPRAVVLPLLEWGIIICTLLGLATVLIDLSSRGHGPQVFLSISALASTARDFSIARYSGGWQEPVAARLLVTSTYLGALLLGVMLATRNSGWTRWAAFVVLVPAAMLAALLTTKSSLLVPLVLLGGSFMASRLAVRAELPRLRTAQALELGAIAITLGGLFLLIQMERYGYTTPAQAEIVARRFSVDLFAYLGVFSAWVQNGGWSSLHPSWGLYTFAGLFDITHLGHRAAGLYTDQVIVEGEPYNIYTAFRGLIEDFTLPGALIVLAAVGFVAQGAYRRVRSGGLSYSAILAAFYVFTVWSFIVDIFIYNTIVLSFLLLAGYLRLAPVPALDGVAVILDLPWRGSRKLSARPKAGST